MSQQINLFNPIFLKEKKHFSAKTMAQAWALIALFAVALFGFAKYQSWKLEDQAVKVVTQLKDVREQQEKIKTGFVDRKKDMQLEETVKRTQQEAESLQQAFIRLRNDEFGTQKGYSDYLRAFARQMVQGVWLTGFSIQGAGNAIGIQGGALKPELVPAYMNRLKRETVMQGKSFATLEISQPKEADRKSGAADSGKGEKKERLPVYVEFDLRSEGVEKPGAKGVVSTSSALPALNPSSPSSGAKGS
ncbi:MAG: MSHA biogenesis protein MshI [Oxalobacter sp.]|nr:MAG: MSHA biogenesis protein MshI [Oxalobacter sp.]